jgi:iron complex outermembrane receptor protein
MASRKFLFSLTSAAVALALLPQQPSYAAEGEQDAGNLEEIVVTARKRAEDILDTPVAVSVLTNEDIEAKGIVSLTDLANNTPGFQITSVNSGRNDRSFQQISLRGLTPSRTTSTLTATFIDGVPVSSANALNSVTRPARVEVLKGPQAAYFGRNAFAGAVNVVNQTPGTEFAGDISVMGGSRDNWDVQGSIEGPLFSEKMGFRINARSYTKDGGWDNLAVPGQTLGDQSTDVVSLMLTAKPVENLSIKLFGMMTQDDDGPSPEGMISSWELRNNNGVLNVPALSASTAGTVIVPSQANCTPAARAWFCGAIPGLPAGVSPGQNTANNALLSASLASSAQRVVSASDGVKGFGLVGEFKHAHLTIDWDIGDSGFTLSSLTGINEYFVSEVDDLDNWNSASITNASNAMNPTGTTPFWTFPFLVEREERDFSQEFRLSFDNDGKFSGLLGASYLKSSAWSDLVSIFSETTLGLPISTRAATSVTSPPKADTTSFFFGATYKVTDKLTVSAEGRQQKDEVEAYTGATALTISPAAANQYGLAAGTYSPFTLLVSREFDHFLPRFIVDYQFNDDLMGYASVSKGVNVALLSFNTNFLTQGSPEILAAADSIGLGVFIDPEKITNYEIGVKGSLLDNRLRGALAIYRAKWTEQQNTRTTFVNVNNVPQIVSGVANTGEVEATGIEVDLWAKVGDSVSVQFAASMNDSDIQSFEDPLITAITGVVGAGYEGNMLPLAPKYSANLGVQYDGLLPMWDEATWYARGDMSYKDKQYLDSSNINWIKARSQVNLRAGVVKGPITIDAFIQNAFDTDDYISAAQNSLLTTVPGTAAAGLGYINVALPERRVFGLKVGYKF